MIALLRKENNSTNIVSNRKRARVGFAANMTPFITISLCRGRCAEDTIPVLSEEANLNMSSITYSGQEATRLALTCLPNMVVCGPA